jgi:uncharacterized MAPEG superfamily protein
MIYTQELQSLTIIATCTVLMWVPYMLARMIRRGVIGTFANPDSQYFAPDPKWAERARRAHANAVENLAVFAPLVLILALTGAGTPATVVATHVYVVARVVHYIVYAAGIPVIRTIAFVTGVGATLVIAAQIIGSSV